MTGSADDTAAAAFRPLLFSIAYGMTGAVGDAEDIVQDAFLGLTRARQATSAFLLAAGKAAHGDGSYGAGAGCIRMLAGMKTSLAGGGETDTGVPKSLNAISTVTRTGGADACAGCV